MRLIDADALIEDFKSRLVDCNDWIENAKDKETKIRASAVKTFIAEVILTINNAPTVEYTFEEAFQKTVCENKLYCPSRPQGEWITRTEDNGVNYRFYCSCCDREVMLITDYCPYCGADMRGGAEE
jgi:formate dehydrogenase maturation protein FdhE